MRPVPYPVQASKLDTQFHSDPECTYHVKFVSDNALNQRRIRKEEKWSRERALGRGSYGIVWLERCIQGDDKGSFRAVKKVQKPESGEYYGELEAIALFSHAKYEHCFVKSLGWYDDENSIFIAMEYLPNGDLQKHLHSSMSEKEARHIIFQVLEGLQFMHDNGFTHRDLKPANILIKSKGPDWWVKIADFGISKHVIEEHTALRTLVGTPSFAAPEMLGFFRPGDRPKDFYTNAVDVWSLGVIAFLTLSAKTPFKDPRRLNQYVMGNLSFPLDVLLFNKVSAQGCDFVSSLMVPYPEDRPKVMECLQHPWFTETAETQRELNFSNFSSRDYLEPEPSASWSTQDQISTNEPEKLVGVPSREASTISSEVAISLNSTSYNMVVPSKSQLAYTDPKPSLDQNVEDQISTRKLRRMPAIYKLARPVAENILVPSIPTKNPLATPSIHTSNKVDASPKSRSHEIVALPVHEPAADAHWEIHKSLKGHTHWVNDVTFSPDGSMLASASADSTIRLWDSATGKEIGKLKGHMSGVLAVAFSPDQTLLASASSDCTVKLWDPITGLTRHTLENHSKPVDSIKFSPDGKLLASASTDKTVKLWDPVNGRIRDTFETLPDWVHDMTFSPKGLLFARESQADRTVRLWDPFRETTLHTFVFHMPPWSIVQFSPDGTLLAYASTDETVELWDLTTRRIRHTLKAPTNHVWEVEFSPDGTLLATTTHWTLIIWDTITGTMREILEFPDYDVPSVAFSPHGNMIAAGGGGGEVIIWRLSTTTEQTNEVTKKSIFLSSLKKLLRGV